MFIGIYFETISRKPFYLTSMVAGLFQALVAPEGRDLYDTPEPIGAFIRGVRNSDSGMEPIGFLRNTMPSTWAYDGLLEGHTTFKGVIVQPIDQDGTNDFSSSFVRVHGGGSPIVLSGRPTIALRAGKVLYFQNVGPDDITLQDDAVIAGDRPGMTLAEILAVLHESRDRIRTRKR